MVVGSLNSMASIWKIIVRVRVLRSWNVRVFSRHWQPPIISF